VLRLQALWPDLAHDRCAFGARGLREPRRWVLGDELRMLRHPVVVGSGTPCLPPVTDDVPLDLIETRTFSLRVIYERYRPVRDDSDCATSA
jgi:hypothetical protein